MQDASLLCYFFFCKQKTAYEMRISDWSSVVCSSDLHQPRAGAHTRTGRAESRFFQAHRPAPSRRYRAGTLHRTGRSEEHTSELQSLMRISYAVFCLKKKNHKHI